MPSASQRRRVTVRTVAEIMLLSMVCHAGVPAAASNQPELAIGLGWLQKAQLDPAGRLLATCSDSAFHLWHLNGTLASVLPAPSGLIIAGFEWSPNGSLIALSNCLGQITILQVPALTMVSRVEYQYDPFLFAPRSWGAVPWPMAWSPNGSLLAISWWSDQVHIFDVETGRHILSYQGSTPVPSGYFLGFGSSIEWFPDGRRIMSCSLGTATQIRDLSDGSIVELKGTLGGRSHDGEMVATVYRAPQLSDRHSAIVYWAANGTQAAAILINKMGWDGASLEWSPDDSIIALGTSDGRMILWRWMTGEVVANVSAHRDSIISMSWEGSCLVSASRDHTVKVWTVNPDSGQLWLARSFVGWGPAVKSLSWYPDGSRLAACRGGTSDYIEIYGEDGSAILQIGPAWNWSSCGSVLSPDGRMMAGVTGRYQVSIWDAEFGTLYNRLDLAQEVTILEWCPGRPGVLALGGSAGVEIRDVSRMDAPLVADLPIGEEVLSMAWSPDGEMLAVGLRFQVGVWDPWTPVLLGRAGREQFHGREVLSLSWSPDGSKLACLAESGTERDPEDGSPTSCTGRRYLANVTVWEVHESSEPLGGGRLVTLLQIGSIAAPPIPGSFFGLGQLARSMDWAPNSTCLAAGTAIWCLDAIGLISTLNLTVPVRPVSCVSWSPDGSRIAVGSLDGSIKLWRVGPPGEIPEWSCAIIVTIAMGVLLKLSLRQPFQSRACHCLGQTSLDPATRLPGAGPKTRIIRRQRNPIFGCAPKVSPRDRES